MTNAKLRVFFSNGLQGHFVGGILGEGVFEGFSSHSRIFHSFGDVTIIGEWLQIMTYVRKSRPSSNEGSLTCHTYCDTGQPFIMFISEDP